MTTDLSVLLLGAVSPEAPSVDIRGQRILDAAVAEAAARGVANLTFEGVATRAGVNRTTLYRRFGDRESLIQAMMLREGWRIAEGITAALAGIVEPRARLAEGFVAAIRIAREHPLIQRLVQHEPGTLLAAGSADSGALLLLGSQFVAGQIRAGQREGNATHLDADEMGETMARLFAILVLIPGRYGINLSDDDHARVYAQRTLIPMIFGPQEGNPA